MNAGAGEDADGSDEARRFARLQELFDKACELDEAGRAALLNGLRGDDALLRDELERLLLHIGEVPSGTAPEPGAGRPTPAADRPARIGPYRIVDEIGSGGMGTVYVAMQSEPIKRRVALKVIRRGLDSREVLRRFALERQALSLMNHPNIAKVFDAGTTEHGQPYFALELVEGIPITEYCDKHRLDLRQRLELFRQVCAGVQHAHHKGVIHRDLKPANVLVTRDGREPIAKIIDFGLARATDALMVEHSLYTQHGQLIGTPEYMSPEQAETSAEGVDARTDVYSLGVMLYELLAGDLPFPSTELRRAGLAEIQRTIREVEPPKPSARFASSLALAPSRASSRHTTQAVLMRNLRGELDWIVMKAIAKEPERRYETPSAFSDDIERHLDNEPVLASPPSAGYRLRKFVGRNRTAVTAAAIVFASLVTAFAMTTSSLAVARTSIEARELAELAADAVSTRRELLTSPLSDSDGQLDARLDAAARLVARRGEIVAAKTGSTDGRVRHRLDDALSAIDELASTLEFHAQRREAAERCATWSLEQEASWAACLRAIESETGWRLAAQPGLVPLGKNPQGSWEFLHLQSCERPRERASMPQGSTPPAKSDGIVFVLVVPEEGFELGDPIPKEILAIGERPTEIWARRWVGPRSMPEIDPYLISKHEVTQAQWRRLTGEAPSVYQAKNYPDHVLAETQPVENVDLAFVRARLRAVGMQLPDEVQWEYAARGGVRTDSIDPSRTNVADRSLQQVYPDTELFSNAPDSDDGHAWTSPVGTFDANPLGLFDVLGNVVELCATDDGPLWGRGAGFKDPLHLRRFAKRFHVGGADSSFGVRPVWLWSASPKRSR